MYWPVYIINILLNIWLKYLEAVIKAIGRNSYCFVEGKGCWYDGREWRRGEFTKGKNEFLSWVQFPADKGRLCHHNIIFYDTTCFSQQLSFPLTCILPGPTCGHWFFHRMYKSSFRLLYAITKEKKNLHEGNLPSWEKISLALKIVLFITIQVNEHRS